MQIISHRGYWLESHERNQLVAFERSFKLGFGTELDVRDCSGNILVCHDMPRGNEIKLEDVLKILIDYSLPIAVNIKADGIAGAVKELFSKYSYDNWFVFDMAVPDMRSYVIKGIKTYARLSDIEPHPVYYDKCQGIWLDAMESLWYDVPYLKSLILKDNKLCVVSEELHGRDHSKQWRYLKEFVDSDNLILCTDHPRQAAEYFKV